ncbi:MAG: prepilin-type N-terminal cleavage/methylation domain-containing protein [Candidatus Pacebacteria bacterium]|nr:prepilin-type N-terminal cleavage/methylation domain-containing protein [Candidatus Paceibacterota bacterium]
MVNTRGFTLIELLVVISIIGILSSIVLASLGSARTSARDTERLSDIKTIQKSLELYFLEYGRYPITSCTSPNVNWTSFDSPAYSPRTLCSNVGGSGSNTLSQELAPNVSGLADPKSLGSDSGYLYISNNGQQYCILVYRTPEDMRKFPSYLIPSNRCSAVDPNTGLCTGANTTEAIYIGTGAYAAGC